MAETCNGRGRLHGFVGASEPSAGRIANPPQVNNLHHNKSFDIYLV